MITNIKPIQGLEEIYKSDFFSPVRTGVDFVAKNLTGIPLVGTIASGHRIFSWSHVTKRSTYAIKIFCRC